MKVSLKIKILNACRGIFKISFLERVLVSFTTGKSPRSFFAKLVPNPYQYDAGSIRLINRNNIKMKVDISDYIGHYLYFGFRDVDLNRLFNLCFEGSNVLDIGTNIGWVAHNLARISKTGKVFGFEPDPMNYDRCAENCVLNSLENLVIFPWGLGSANATIGMEIRTPSNFGGNRIAPSGAKNSRGVLIKRLDDVASIQELSKIDLIKIDVEGYELKVLQGAEKTLIKHRPVLFIEIDDNNLKDQNDSATALIQTLVNLGYQDIRNAIDDLPVTSQTDFTNCHFDIIAK
ncbi:MAG: FkbM family methyltransferase [Cyclobacteriaceae bacterium]